MGTASIPDSILFAVSFSALALELVLIWSIWKLRRALNHFPGSDLLRIIFWVMVGIAVSQAFDVWYAALAYAKVDNPEYRTHFLGSHIAVMATMAWGYLRSSQLY